jgi:hypothetical protein
MIHKSRFWFETLIAKTKLAAAFQLTVNQGIRSTGIFDILSEYEVSLL